MQDYFKVENIEYTTNGFGLFSWGHLLWILIGIAFCIAMCMIYRKTARRKATRYIVVFSAVFLELFRAFLLIRSNQYDVYRLPLHLCGISVYLILIHALTDNSKLWQFLYAFCFPGAVFAILFPDWYYYPLFNVLTSIGFELHILIVTYILMQLCEHRPDIRSAPRNLLIMALIALPVFFFNRIVDANYMFLNYPVMPLTLFSFLGRPLYILGYIPLITVCWAIMYLPFRKKSDNSI